MSTRSPGQTSSGSWFRRNRRIVMVALIVVVIAGVAGGAYGLWYILIGPASPSAVAAAPPVLPGNAVAAPASLDGTWTVNTTLGTIDDGTASFVGYRVQEQLVGVGGHTAVGRTTRLTGSMTLAGAVIDNVQVTADMTALTSDQPERDGQLKGQAIQTDTFTTAMFKTIQPINLGTLPAEGTIVKVDATGALTLHGVTRTVTIGLQATRQGGVIAVSGELPILFSDWSVQRPTSFAVLSVDDHGIMELHLLFTHS